MTWKHFYIGSRHVCFSIDSDSNLWQETLGATHYQKSTKSSCARAENFSTSNQLSIPCRHRQLCSLRDRTYNKILAIFHRRPRPRAGRCWRRQTNLSFRLGQRYDAICNVNHDHVVFLLIILGRNNSCSVRGRCLSTFEINSSLLNATVGTQWNSARNNVREWKGVRWHLVNFCIRYSCSRWSCKGEVPKSNRRYWLDFVSAEFRIIANFRLKPSSLVRTLYESKGLEFNDASAIRTSHDG